MTNAANWGGSGPPGSADIGDFSTGATSTTPTLGNGASMTVGEFDFLNPSQSYAFSIQGIFTLSGLGVTHANGASSPTFTVASTSSLSNAQLFFTNSATADDSSSGNFVTYNVQPSPDVNGSTINFQNSSTAGSAIINCTGAGTLPSKVNFFDSSTGGTSIINVGPGFNSTSGFYDFASFVVGTINSSAAVDLQNANITLSGGSHIINSSVTSSGNTTLILKTITTPIAGSAFLSLKNSYNFGTLNSDSGTTISFDNNTSILTIGSSNNNSTINGKIIKGSTDGSILKIGTGTLFLTNTGNNFSQGVTISQGAISIPDDRALGAGVLKILNGSTLAITSSNTSSRTIELGTSAGGMFAPSNGVTYTISGFITDVTTNGSLTQSGPGILTISNSSPTTPNNYSGGTTIAGGILSIVEDRSLGSAITSVTINNGATLNVTSSITTSRNFAVGSSTGTAAIFTQESSGVTYTITGQITDNVSAGGVSQNGPGTLVFNNTIHSANSYSGGTTINGGTLSIANDSNLGNNSGAVIINSGATLNALGTVLSPVSRGYTVNNGIFSQSSSGVLHTIGAVVFGTLLTQNGPGNLRFLTNNDYTGPTTINGGTLAIAGDGSLGTNSVTINSGGTLDLFASGTTTSSRSFTVNNGTFTQSGDGTHVITSIVSGSGLIQGGPGTLSLSNTANTYGTTSISSGILTIATDGSLGTGGVSIDNAATLNATATTSSSRSFFLGSGATGAIFTQASSAVTHTISGAISDITTNGVLNQSGPGTLSLTHASNTYGGGTIIGTSSSSATLSIVADGSLGNGGAVKIQHGSTLKVTADTSSSRDFSIDTSSNGGSVFSQSTGVTHTISGAISDITTGGELIENGLGTLALTNPSNGYSGGTNITAGTLSISYDGSLGVETGVFTSISAGATLNAADSILSSTRNFKVGASPGGIFSQSSSSVNHVIGGIISDLNSLGVVTQSGPGTLTLSGVNTYDGGTTISGGNLSIVADNNLGAANTTVTINSPGVLNVTGTFSTSRPFTVSSGSFSQTTGNTYTINGQVSGSSLSQSGPGTLVLANTSNNYTGATSITGGTLSVGSDSNLGNASASVSISNGTLLATAGFTTNRTITVNNAAFAESGTNTLTISSSITGTNLTQSGPGILQLISNNNYNGTTNISGGTLRIGADGNLGPNTTNVTIQTGAKLSVLNSTASSRNFSLGTGAGGIFTQTPSSVLYTISGTISDITTSGVLQQNGTGTLLLANPSGNTYTGGTIISGGTLSIANDNNLGNGGDVQIGNGSTLAVTGETGSSRNFLIDTGLPGATFTEASGVMYTISGTISNLNSSGFLVQAGPGTLSLTSGNNSYTGGTNITGGILSITTDGNLGTNTVIIQAGATLNVTETTSSNRNFSLCSSPGSIFTQGSSSVNHTISGTINNFTSNTGLLVQNGPGTLTLANLSANGYTGGTQINGGTLSISNDNNLGTGGSVTIQNGAVLNVSATPPSPSARAFLLGSGSGAVFTQTTGVTYTISGTISDLTSNGVLNQHGTGTLAITNASANTYSGGTTISGGTLSIGNGNTLGTGRVTMQSGTTLLATISTTSTQPFTCNNGRFAQSSGSVDHIISSVLSGTNITQNGPGTLTLSNAGNNYTGSTAISAGGVLNLTGGGSLPSTTSVTVEGTLDVSAASGGSQAIGDLSGNGGVTLGTTQLTTGSSNASTTYSGAFSGTGTLTKVGNGRFNLTGDNSSYAANVFVNGGKLALNGTLGGNIQVNAGGTLSGGGSTAGAVTNDGTVSPGNSVATLTMASYTSAINSITSFEITPTPGVSSQIITTGAGGITINSPSTLALNFDPGDYDLLGSTYTLLSATNGGTLSGTFIHTTGSPPGFGVTLDYTGTSLFLILEPLPIATLVSGGGNAGSVADALNQLYQTGNADLDNVISSLLSLANDPAALIAALDQLQPSVFKGLAIAQEDMMIRVREAFSFRMNQYYLVDCIRDCSPCEKVTLWAAGIGDYSKQSRVQGQTSFHTLSGGGIVGVDFADYHSGFFFGTGAGYTHTNIHWTRHQAKGDINSYYGALYGGYFIDFFYMDAAVLASYNQYDASRRLVSPVFNREAHNKHNGFELDGNFDIGFMITYWPIEIRPFDQFDYIYLWEDDFTEHGADSLDLHVRSDVYTEIRNEVGLGFADCWLWPCWKLTPQFKLSWVYEKRFQGRHYRSKFVDTKVLFEVSGMNPHRSLFCAGAALTGYYKDDNLSWSIYWQGEWGAHYTDENAGLEISYRF